MCGKFHHWAIAEKKQAEKGVEVGISRGIEERNMKVEFRMFN